MIEPARASYGAEPEPLTQLRETLRHFVAHELTPEKRRAFDRAHQFPRDAFARLAALGVCGLTVGPEHELFFAYGLSEPDVGGDLASVRTRAARTPDDVHFDQVQVPAANVLGADARWNRQFGRPLSGHQAVRHASVDARTRLEACRHMLQHAAWLANEGRPCANLAARLGLAS